MEFYTRYNTPPEVSVEFTKPSLTEQHFKDECDINNIVAQYQQTGVMPSGDRQPLFGDFSEFPQDLQASQAFFDEAAERFMQLSSDIRKRFGNDPVQLLAFLHDENNRDEAISLGLVNAPAPPPQASETVQSQNTNVSSKPSEEGKN